MIRLIGTDSFFSRSHHDKLYKSFRVVMHLVPDVFYWHSNLGPWSSLRIGRKVTGKCHLVPLEAFAESCLKAVAYFNTCMMIQMWEG